MKRILLQFLTVLAASISAHAQLFEQPPVYTPTAGQPKNIILMIADGMGTTDLTAALIKNGDSLNMDRFPQAGFLKSWSPGDIAPDPKSAITAIATGKNVQNGYLGLDNNEKPIKTLMEYAKDKNMALGIVTTSAVTHPSTAAFLAHSSKWDDQDAIALEYLRLQPEVIIGGGLQYFGENRVDKRNLLQEFKEQGYEVEDKAKKVGKIHSQQILALVSPQTVLDYKQRKDFLTNATENALQMLYGKSGMGFFLIVENPQIGWAGNGNDINYRLGEVLDFDKAVGKALNYFGSNQETLIVVVSSHDRGGLTITSGDLKSKEVKIKWTSQSTVPALTPVFAIGPGAEHFAGMYSNTEVFEKLRSFIEAR
jgi:alkaline phosphatase